MTAGEESDNQDMSSVEKQVKEFLESKGISQDTKNVEICRPLPRRRETDKPEILLKFVNQKQKAALSKQGRNLKGTNVFMNDTSLKGMPTSIDEHII